MFESLTTKLQGLFKNLSGQGHLTESNIEGALKEIRLALLEADVHFKVAKDFLERVRVKALGQEVLQSLTPAQVLAKIVQDELTELMGGAGSRHLAVASLPPTVILMVGLQGTGKTTTTAKLARFLKQSGRKVMLAAADLARPAAVTQLQVLGQSLGVEVFTAAPGQRAPDVAEAARQAALLKGIDVLLVDTAGRLAIDEALMAELKEVKRRSQPHEILLIVDAMAGQDAVETARRFNEALGIDGLILTKMDGDARGGAALSILAVTGKPIKFVGMGEKVEALEPFYPDRLASRILGMGDVVSLVEKVQANVDQEKAAALAKKLAKENFTLADFLEQLQTIKKMGPISDLMGMIPGMPAGKMPEGAADEKSLKLAEAILQSMSAKERRLPQILDGSRRKRVARGAGTSVEEVNKLLRQYEQMKKMMKMMRKGGRFNPLRGLMGGGLGMPRF
jgi:signal recognition particle subunit SRP54